MSSSEDDHSLCHDRMVYLISNEEVSREFAPMQSKELDRVKDAISDCIDNAARRWKFDRSYTRYSLSSLSAAGSWNLLRLERDDFP
jgi:hypothetical protein